MDYQFIDITSFRCISSEAEHFYAKVGDSSGYAQENILFMASADVNTGVSFVEGNNRVYKLRYHPTREEAISLYLKDNYGADRENLGPEAEDRIFELMEDGTTRFKSVLSIVRECRQRFPNSILCFSMSGSRKEFAKWMARNSESETVKEIIRIIVP